MKTIKVVYNACFGGFGLSKKAALMLRDLGVTDVNLEYGYIDENTCPRHDERLIQVVEELGKDASGRHAKLEIHQLSGNRYRIDEYDGNESVIEPYEAETEWITVK
jgi:hypothetical protein